MKRRPILLADGTIISVQASSTHYCSPKSDAAYAYNAVDILVDKPHDLAWNNGTDKRRSEPKKHSKVASMVILAQHPMTMMSHWMTLTMKNPKNPKEMMKNEINKRKTIENDEPNCR